MELKRYGRASLLGCGSIIKTQEYNEKSGNYHDFRPDPRREALPYLFNSIHQTKFSADITQSR
jgi:hypothetical protein